MRVPNRIGGTLPSLGESSSQKHSCHSIEQPPHHRHVKSFGRPHQCRHWIVNIFVSLFSLLRPRESCALLPLDHSSRCFHQLIWNVFPVHSSRWDRSHCRALYLPRTGHCVAQMDAHSAPPRIAWRTQQDLWTKRWSCWEKSRKWVFRCLTGGTGSLCTLGPRNKSFTEPRRRIELNLGRDLKPSRLRPRT